MTHLNQSIVLSEDSTRWIFPDGRTIPVIAGGDGEGGAPDVGAQPAETEPTQDQPTANGNPSTASPAKGQGAAPWAADLERMGLNDPKFDEYLRTQWQPRMTQTEQRAAQYESIFGTHENAQFAGQLLTALDENPVEALRYMARELKVDPIDLIEELTGEQDDSDVEGDQSEEQPEGDDLEAKLRALIDQDPRIQHTEQQMSAAQQAEHDQALGDLLDGIDQHYSSKGDTFNRDLYVHLLKAADGDADQAFEAYEMFHTPAAPPEDPPPVSGGSKGATPRQQPRAGSIAEAVKAFTSDQLTASGS